MSDEYERFSKILSDHGGRLPICDDQLAATAIRDLVLDMGYDPHWAKQILVSALNKVNDVFDLEPVTVVPDGGVKQ